jgi:MFS family permease
MKELAIGEYRMEQIESVGETNEKKHYKFYFAIGIFSFGYNFITTAEYVHFQDIMDIGFGNDLFISILFASALASLCLGAIFGGIINDSMRTKYGQRAPAIFAGSLITMFLFFIIPIITELITNTQLAFGLLLSILIISHFSLGFAYSPWLALFTDLVPDKKRFTAGVIVNILSAIGAAIAVLFFSFLVDNGFSWIVWVVSASVFGLSAFITTILIPKTNPDESQKMKISDFWKIPKTIWQFGGRDWILLLIIGGFWAFGSHLIETGLIDSLVKRFAVSEMIASLSTNILMGAIIAILLVPIIWGTNKIGKVRSGIITSIIYGIFCVLLALMPKFEWIYFIMILGGIGNILLSTLQIVLPMNRVPKGKEASFLGVFFIFGTVVKPFATMLQGFIINGMEANNEITIFGGYPWTFIIAGIIILFAILPLIFMKNKTDEKKNQIKVGKEKEEITL